MHKIKNIFPIIYDFENLFNAYKAGIKCKRYRPDVMAYTDKLEENLIELQNEFIWQTYTVGRYNIFYVYEPKKRMIMSLQFKDRVAQHAIYSQLNPHFEKQFINDSYACRVGKGTHKAVNRLRYAPEPKRTVLAGNGQAISRTGEEASQQMRSILRILRQR